MALPARPLERIRVPPYGVEEDQLLQVQGPLDVFATGSQTPLTSVDLGDVFINDKATLHEVELLSRRNYPMRVFISWEQASEKEILLALVEFQLENVNLSASREASDTSAPKYYNELLNQACTVSDFVLPAGRRQPLVLVLYPCVQDPAAAATSFLRVHGLVHFSARRATAAELEAEGLSFEGGCAGENSRERESERPPTGACQRSQGIGKEGIGNLRGDGRESDVEETLLEVKAKVCRSILSADIRELQFLEACPGASYVKEFSVWNKSEIPLTFRLVPSVWLSAEAGVLACSDYDTGAPLPTSSPGRTIGAYAHLRVRVAFRPREVGERDYRIFVENLNNVADTLAVDILTSVVADSHREGLRIQTERGELLEGGSVLQFDNCYTGIPMPRRLRMKNTTVKAMDISLGSDRPGEVMFELETDASASYRRARRRLTSIGNSEESRMTGSGRSGNDVAFSTGAGLGIDGRSFARGTSSQTESGESGSAHGEEGQADYESEVPVSGERVMGSHGDSFDNFLEAGKGERQFYALDSKAEWGSDRIRLTVRSSIFSRRGRRRDHGGSRVREGDERSRGSGTSGSGAASGFGSSTRCRKLRGSCLSGDDSDDSNGGCLGSGDSGSSSRSTRFGNGLRVRGLLSGQASAHKRIGRTGQAVDDDNGEEYDDSDAADVVGARSARAAYADRPSGRRSGVLDGKGASVGGVRGSSNRGSKGRGWVDYVEKRQGRKGVYGYGYGDDDGDDEDGDDLEASRDKRTARHQRRKSLHNLGHHSGGVYGGLCAFHGSVHSPAGWNATSTSGEMDRAGSGSVGGGGDDEAGSHFVGGRSNGVQPRGAHCRVCAEISKRARQNGVGPGRKNEGQERAVGQQANNYIEEVSLGPGVERILRVHFCAASSALDAVATAGGAAGDADDGETTVAASNTTACAAGVASTALLSSQERGRGRRGLAAAARGTTLLKQAFKLFFTCQEPRGKWDDAFLDESVDAEGYIHPQAIFRRKSSIGSDVRKFSKNIAGRAMVCTSVLTVAPREIAFGNCNIGEYKSHTLEIGNMSDLPAVAIAHVVSKVVTCKPSKLKIPAHGKAEMKVEYVPRKINSKYRKTVTIVNCLNPHGNVGVEITGSNIDTHHVLYHSHFYKVLVNNRMRQQQVYYNHVVTGCPALRTFEIQNVYDRPLFFELGADTPEIQIYEMVGSAVKRASRSLMPAGTVGETTGSGAGVGTKSTVWSGSGASVSGSASSSRDQFSKAPSVSGRSKVAREGRRLHGPIRGMDLEMPPGSNRKYRAQSSYAGATTGNMKALRSVGLAASDGADGLGESVGGVLITGGSGTGAIGGVTAIASGSGTGSTKDGGGGTGAGGIAGASAIPGGDEPAWTLKQLTESFETDHLGSTLDSGEEGDRGRVAVGGGAIRGGAGGGQSDGINSRTEREIREWQAQVMTERVVQLRRAVKEGRLKPLADRLFQAHPGKHSRIAVVLNLASTGDAEELERERTVERHIQMRLLNVNSSHLPPSLRRGAPVASADGVITKRTRRSGLAGPWREPLRIRNLLVRGKACRSEMSVAQKNINFGKVAVGEYATRTVELTNRSPVPMLYSISKSMSISSGFLKIPQGGKGVIPPHRSKEIKFAFCPSLAGTFAESLSVTNVLDEGSTQIITIKAKVYKPETFALVDPPEVMRLEPCLVGEPISAKPCGEARVLLRNTTPRRRLFVIEGIDAYSAAKSAAVGRDSCDSGHAAAASIAATSLSEGMPPSEGGSETSIGGTEGESAKGGSLSPRPDMASSRLRLSSTGSDVTTATDFSRPIHDSGASVLTNFSEVTSCSSTFRFKLDAVSTPGIPEVERQRMEEKLEQCLFKLRIAERKGREAKVAKMHKKIDRLRKQLAGETLGSDEGDETGMSESESDSDAELQLRERTGSGWGSCSIGGGGTGVGSNGVVKREGVGRLELSVDGDSEIAVGISLSFTPGACFHGWEGGHLFRGVIRLYEYRNEDVVKKLPCLAQVYSSALAYQAVLQPSASPSVEDEVEDREVLSPMPPPSDGGSRGRKTSGKTMMPPRSPTELPSSNTSPTLSVSTSFSGGSVPTLSAPSHPAGTGGSNGSCSGSGSGSVGSGGGGGGGTSPVGESVVDGGGTGGSGDGWGNESAPVSPRGGGLPELLRQVGIQTMRVFGGGLSRDKERRDQSREPPEDADAEGSVGVDGNAGADDGTGSLLVPIPQRPDQSPPPSLVEPSAAGIMRTSKHRADRTSSPASNLPRRRASYPAAARPRSFVDLRGGDTRNSGPLSSSVLEQARDVYDPGRNAALETRRTSAPPAIPAFDEVTPSKSSGDASGEPPLFVTVAHFCTLGATEEGVVSPAMVVGDVDEGHAGNLPSVGGGGAVTPALLPALFHQGPAGCAISEGVKMVLSSGEYEAGAAPGGSASPGMFSLHSMASRDVIVKVSWDKESAERLGVLPVPSPAFMFRAEPPKSGSQTALPPAGVLVAVLHAGSTLDISVKLDGPVSVPLGRWCVGAVMVVVIDQSQAHGDSAEGGHGGNGSGCGSDQKLLVPLVLEVLPESCLGVPRKVDLGSVGLNSHTSSSFEVQNLSSASAPQRFVVMVAGKPATNSLQLTSQQTGTLPPGGSMDVSFVFHATSIGRWTHDLAVRNLGNKHDQAKVTVSATVKPHMYLHFPDLDPKAKGKPEKLHIGYIYMPGPSESDPQQTPLNDLIGGGNAFPVSEIVRPLRVHNVSDRKLYLTCTPNLRKQCFVYAEASPNSSHDAHPPEGRRLRSESGDGATAGSDLASVAEAVVPRPGVTDFPLLEQSEMTLYIGLRPVLPPEAYTSGDCRELIGGVRILGHSRAVSDSPLAAIEATVEGKNGFEFNEDSPTADSETGSAEPTEGAARSSGSLQVGAEAVGARMAADRLFELTIKFVGTVGVSILRIPGKDSPFSLLNLGCGTWTGGINIENTGVVNAAVGLGATPGSRRRIICGCLELENVTKALPLVYRLDVRERQGHIVGDHASDSNDTGILARLGALPEGSAELVVLAEAVGTMPPASRRSVRFCILVHAFRGAFHRQISVQNISSSGSGDTNDTLVTSKPLTYHVRLFVDDGCVQLELPSPPEASIIPTPPEVRPLISTGSAIDPVATVNFVGHEAALQQGKQLTDELGNALPSLETLTVPFIIPVAPCETSPAAEVESLASIARGEDRSGYREAKLSRFRVLQPVVENDDLSNSGACDDLTEMYEIGEHVETVSGRDWTPFSGYQNPTTRAARDGLRVNRSDIGQARDVDDAAGVIFRLTNAMDSTIFLAPYSNAPLIVEPVAIDKRCVDEASAGLFEFENDGDECREPMDGFECGAGVERPPTPVMRDDVEEGDRQGSLVRCGPAITLTANATAVIRLGVRAGALTRSLPTSSVESGYAVPFDGIIAFARIGEASTTLESRVVYHSGGWDGGECAPDRVEYHNSTSESSSPDAHLRLVKLVRAVGTYCRPRFEIAGPVVIDLGNVGHTASKRGRRRFEVRLRNLCDTPVPVGMVGISSELDVVTEMDGTYGQRSQENVDRMVFHRRKAGPRPRSSSVGSAGSSAGEIYPRADGSHAGVFSSSGWGKRRVGDGGSLGVIVVPPRGEATLVFQLRLSRRRQSWAGPQTFGIRLANLADSSAEEVSVSVLARVVTQLVSFIGLDEVPPSPILRRLISPGTPTLPELSARRRARSSSIEAFGSFSASSEGCSVRLAPPAIPPPRGSTGRCTGSFQVKNVSDETVSVTLRAMPAPEVSGVLSLGASLQQQDSSTGVYASAGADGRPSPSVALLPGDVLDVHAECLAQPGGRLTPELLQLPTSASDGGAEGIPVDMREGGLDWDQHLRLLGTVLVEIALEEREGDPDGSDGESEQGEGVLIESVALVGSLIPGPTFELSRKSVTVTLRPPTCGGGGGMPCDRFHPFEPEGSASFFVESLSPSQRPVRFRIEGGGRLHLTRGLNLPAADDEVGGTRHPARVVKVVTAIAEPCRGIISAKSRREVAVRLTAAGQEFKDVPREGESNDRRGSADVVDSGYADIAGGQDRCDLFVRIADDENPGYPPQIVTVNVEIPVVDVVGEDSQAVGLLGASCLTGGVGDASLDLYSYCERDSEGTYSVPNEDVVDESGQKPTFKESSIVTSLEPAPLTKKPPDSARKQSSGVLASGGSPARTKSARATEAAASIAAATAAAIAAGPLSLVASASEAAATVPMERLEVRGCTPVGPTASLFEINLGQQLVCLSSLEWPISLMGPPLQRVRRGSNSSSLLSVGENRRILLGRNGGGSGGGWIGAGGGSGAGRPGRLSLKFRLSTLHTSDAEWLTLGQREGQLMEGAIQDVTLYFNRSRVGFFSTYLVVENLNNPADLKVVRVEMEVVDGGLKDNVSQLFDVLVPPAIPESGRGLLSNFGTAGTTAGGSGSSGNGTVHGVSLGINNPRTRVGDSSAKGSGVGSVMGIGGSGMGKWTGTSHGITNSRGISEGGIGGANDPLVLDFGDVYEGKLYQWRSFVIVNHAAMPLEFQLSSSLPATEVNFSLSAMTLKRFKSVHIEANTRLQVYVHYQSVAKRQPEEARNGSDDSCQEAEVVLVRERLSVTCRLVKDFQQEIQLVARHHSPQVRLLVEGNLDTSDETRNSDSLSLLYVVREKSTNDNTEGEAGGTRVEVDGQQSRLVTVKNLRSTRRVVIAVVNATMYFSVTPITDPSGRGRSGYPAVGDATGLGFRGWVQGLGGVGVPNGIELFEIPAGESLTLRVTPRLDKLRSGAGLALLVNEQRLEEHFIVYNRRHPTEQYRISLKLTSGALRMFFLSPGSKNAYPFRKLENKITTFMKAYQLMWKEFLQLNPPVKALLSGERGAASNKESDSLLFRQALDRLDATMIAAGELRPNFGVTGSPAESGGGSGGLRRMAPAVGSGSGMLATTAALAQQSSRLVFEMCYITDELLYYALKNEGFVGEFALRLANLVYSVVFRHEVFMTFVEQHMANVGEDERAPVFLRRWGAHLNNFLGYFPYPKPLILPLLELRRSLAPCFAALSAA